MAASIHISKSYLPCLKAMGAPNQGKLLSSLEAMTREEFEGYVLSTDPNNFFHSLLLCYPLENEGLDNKEIGARLLQICADRGWLSELLLIKNKAGRSPLEDALKQEYDAYAPLVELLLPYYPYEALIEIGRTSRSPIVQRYLATQIFQKKTFALGLVTGREQQNSSLKGLIAHRLYEPRLAALIGRFLA